MPTSDMWITVLQYLLGGGVLAGVGALVKGFAEKRKLNSEARRHDVDTAAVLSNATVVLLGPMTEQVTALESRIARQNVLIDQQAEQIRVQGRLIHDQTDQLSAQAKIIGTLETQLSAMAAEIERLRRDRTDPAPDLRK